MNITLDAISRENYIDVIKLAVTDDQQTFIIPNVYSMAQALAQKECIPLAICLRKKPIGFLMYCIDEADGEYWIYRFMIDKKNQSKGYGRKAFKVLLKQIKRDKKHHRIFLGVETRNFRAREFFEAFGFKSTEKVEDGELIYLLEY